MSSENDISLISDDGQREVVTDRMTATDPYTRKLFDQNPYAESAPVSGRLVTVLHASVQGRGLQLINPISRALRQHDVHELIITDEEQAGPGARVERVWYAGFFEVEAGGMAIVGAPVTIGGRPLGELVGFDETHMPNHLNIVLRATSPATGLELGLRLGDSITIAGRSRSSAESE